MEGEESSASRGRNMRAKVLFDRLMVASWVRTGRVGLSEGEMGGSSRWRVIVPSELGTSLRCWKGSTLLDIIDIVLRSIRYLRDKE